MKGIVVKEEEAKGGEPEYLGGHHVDAIARKGRSLEGDQLAYLRGNRDQLIVGDG